MCCSHCCGVQKNCTRLLSRVLAAGVVLHRGEGWGLLIALGDRQTDLYNCTLILSQAVGFTISPQSHVHGPARDLNGSTPLVCG